MGKSVPRVCPFCGHRWDSGNLKWKACPGCHRSLPKVTHMIRLLCLLLIVTSFNPHEVYAAKLRVTWTAPTQNSDGSPLTDLTGYRVEWGSCNADGSFGTYQAGINVAATATSTWIYPTGLNPVCARLYAINSANVLSAPAYASGFALPTLGQPVH